MLVIPRVLIDPDSILGLTNEFYYESLSRRLLVCRAIRSHLFDLQVDDSYGEHNSLLDNQSVIKLERVGS
jgi:hypothetical protein